MSNTPTSDYVSRADVFSRGSLNLTYELLRKKDAELALVVRNICHSESLPKEEKEQDNLNADYFWVGLDSFQVRAIVEGLLTLNSEDPGRIILTKALVNDWIKLAEKMINELPDDQKPALN